MNNNKSLTVVHASRLIEASYTLNSEQLRLIALACTKVNSKKDNPEDVGVISITAKDYIDSFNIQSPENAYRDLKNIVSSIMAHPIIMERLPEEITEDNPNTHTKLSWFTEYTYSQESLDKKGNKGLVTIEFSPSIAPFIFKLKKKFVSIDFEIAKQLTTTPLRFYQWFKHEMDLLKEYQPHSERIITIELSVKEIKERLMLTGKYDKYAELDRWIISPAMQEIQQKTKFTVKYKPSIVGHGRKYNTITFTILDETNKAIKPVKPVLPPRPRAKVGTDLESKWHVECFNALSKHRQELKEYDAEAKLNLVDMKKLLKHAEYLKYSDIAKDIQREIEERSTKKPANAQEPEQVPATENRMINLYSVMLKGGELSDYERELKDAYKNVPIEALKGVLVPAQKPQNISIGEVDPQEFERQKLAAIEAGRKALEAANAKQSGTETKITNKKINSIGDMLKQINLNKN